MSSALEEEFAAYVRARQQTMLHAAYLVCGDHHRAQDLLQEALTKLASRWEQVRDGSPDAYVRRILYRDNVSHWRKWRRETTYDVTAPDGVFARRAGGDAAAEWVSGQDVRAALAQLPPRQRAVVVLRYYEDLSEAQIADALGISPGTVKSQASGALANLRRLMPEFAPALAGEGGE